MNQPRPARRQFLQTTAAAAATAHYFPWTTSAFANTSPNDRPNFVQIGIGGMGRGDAGAHKRFANLIGVCDVDQGHADRAKNDKKIGEGKCETFNDYRKVLERDDVDVVSIATPDHWHVKIAIEALEAGKHVFCQKPLTDA